MQDLTCRHVLCNPDVYVLTLVTDRRAYIRIRRHLDSARGADLDVSPRHQHEALAYSHLGHALARTSKQSCDTPLLPRQASTSEHLDGMSAATV